MDTNALFNIGYGLYVLTAKQNKKDNGCIINTAMQVTSEPCRIVIAVNKQNFTSEMIENTGKFNLSILTEMCDFEIFKNFGYQSGKSVDKFSDFTDFARSSNGLIYLTQNTNSYISATVNKTIDLGTHLLFIATVTDAKVINTNPTVTYSYYQSNIKPKPVKTIAKGWRCKICGYIYEGDPLPDDFICPICKHGAIDFEKVN